MFRAANRFKSVRALLERLEERTLFSTAPAIVGVQPDGSNVDLMAAAVSPFNLTAGTITTFTTLTATVTSGLTVALVARVQSSNAGSLPTGTVTFRLSTGAIIATLPVNAATTNTSNPALGQVSVGLPLSLISPGTHSLIASYSGDALHAISTSNTVSLANVARGLVAIGSPFGVESSVTVLDTATGTILRRFDPFPGFTGGVHVAVGDVNGDGVPDVVVSAGVTGMPAVRVYDVVTGTFTRSFFAFDTAFRGGVNLALGDIDGDLAEDIVVAAGPGGGPHVEVFNGRTGFLMSSFYAYDAAFRGGVNIAAGEVTGDGRADIVVAPESLGGPQVKVLDGRLGTLERSFFGFTSTFRGGLSVGIVDSNQDGVGEIVTAPGAGVLPQVQIFPPSSNVPLGSFVAGSQFATGGLNLSTFDFNGDGVPDIVVGSANGAFRPIVFNGLTRVEIGLLLPLSVAVPSNAFIGGFAGGIVV